MLVGPSFTKQICCQLLKMSQTLHTNANSASFVHMIWIIIIFLTVKSCRGDPYSTSFLIKIKLKRNYKEYWNNKEKGNTSYREFRLCTLSTVTVLPRDQSFTCVWTCTASISAVLPLVAPAILGGGKQTISRKQTARSLSLQHCFVAHIILPWISKQRGPMNKLVFFLFLCIMSELNHLHKPKQSTH